MRKEKSFPWIAVAIFAAFGVLCFSSGFLTSNITNKKNLRFAQSRLTACQHRFLEFSQRIIANLDASVRISGEVAALWQESVKNGFDFNARMLEFQEQNKLSLSGLKLNDDLIDVQIPEMEKYMRDSMSEYDVVKQLYDIYKRSYELVMIPAGTLEGFNSSREALALEQKDVRARLLAFMPMLDDTSLESGRKGASRPPWLQKLARQAQGSASQPAEEKIKLEERLGFDQRIKQIAGNMTYRQVESMAGVPRDKQKVSQEREVWMYPSEISGSRNAVYFASGKVLQIKNLPLNSKLD
jgi:hypothetical protein